MSTTYLAKAIPATNPERQLRDIMGELVDMIEKTNNIAEIIDDKLFGITLSEACDQACPNNQTSIVIQPTVERALRTISELHSRLDRINSRL